MILKYVSHYHHTYCTSPHVHVCVAIQKVNIFYDNTAKELSNMVLQTFKVHQIATLVWEGP